MEEQVKYREDTFVARWIAGELSDTESQQFEQWVEANPDEKQYFDELKTTWSDFGSIELARGLSKDERWDRISERLYLTPESFSRSEERGAGWKWTSLAVAVALTVGFFYLWNSWQVQTMISPRGSRITATLPDGSKVNLNAETTIEFDERGWDEKRELQLTGEAFFEVIEKDAPFLVKTEYATTEVLGTSFNVKARGNVVEVACVTGKVSVRSSRGSHEPVTLSPGLATLVVGDSGPRQPYAFGADEKTGWTQGALHFRSKPLAAVFHEIARQFDVTITLEATIENADFTGRIELGDVTRALEFVCLTSGLSFRSTDDSTFIVY